MHCGALQACQGGAAGLAQQGWTFLSGFTASNLGLACRYEERLKAAENEKERMKKEDVDRYKAITERFAEEKERLERKVNTAHNQTQKRRLLMGLSVAPGAQDSLPISARLGLVVSISRSADAIRSQVLCIEFQAGVVL